MATRIQIRRDTEANWTSANPVLASGELALSTDVAKIKIGDSSTAWASLGYATVSQDAVQSLIDASIANIVDGAPDLLNTLNELAAAVGDDANFITTIQTSVDAKVAKAGDTMTGDLTLAQDPSSNLHAATKQYVDTAESDAVSTASADATSKANTAESNANTYTDDLIGDETIDGTEGNTVAARIAAGSGSDLSPLLLIGA
jgi:hypothetical protein